MEFNETKETDTTRGTDIEENRTTNYEGGEAFEIQTPELQLYKNVANNLLEDSFYEDDEEAFEGVLTAFDAVADSNPEFTLKMAAYAQQTMGLRDVSNLLLVVAANDGRTVLPDDPEVSWVRDYAPHILARPDDAMTVIAMHDELYDGSLPSGLRKGVADALHKWDAYQFAKYDTDRRQVNLRDVVNRTHPTPQDDEHDEIFERLIRGPLDAYDEVEPLESPTTWEVIVSESVADAIPEGFSKAKRDWVETHKEEIENLYGEGAPRNVDEAIDAFEELDGREFLFDTQYTRDEIEELREEGRLVGYRNAIDQMGLFAKIRNVRNMLDAGMTGDEIFGDEDMGHVRNSQFFPFRFYQSYRAYEETEHTDEVVEKWLSDAMEETVDNVPTAWGDTFVAVDISKSMENNHASRRSNLNAAEISTFFGAVLSEAGADVGVFGSDFEEMSFHHGTPVIERQKQMLNKMGELGGSTNAWKVLRYLNTTDKQYDRLVFLTDMQAWDNEMFLGSGGLHNNNEVKIEENTVREWLDTYRLESNPDLGLYNIDLSHYGDLMTPEDYPDVYNLAGWNSRIFEFIEYAEEPNDILDDIRSFEP